MSNPSDSLQSARKRLFDQQDEAQGAICPCCDQLVKRYRRHLNAEISYFLIQLVARYKIQKSWVDVKDFKLRGGDYAKAVYWGLAESAPNTDPKLRSSGMWRPTPKGVDFVMNRIQLPRTALVRNGQCQALIGKDIGIEEALKKRFNYAQLMAGMP